MITEIMLDFEHVDGRVKPMHAVNNGPVGSKVRMGNSTYAYFREAGIPYARNHDAAFSTAYGGEYTVDVHRIFRDFDADPEDPANYDFVFTDGLITALMEYGVEPYFRLGVTIENQSCYKAYRIYPPKDFHKWARICEHIIRHYNEGWANGFHYGIEYWEIWNEPDCRNHDGSNPCWQGTNKEFIELYAVAATHLKKCFPNIKIGGPAFTTPFLNEDREEFLRVVKEKYRRSI